MNTWGQDFGYDGFGNLLSQAPKSGYPDASPNVLLTVNAANNRISSTNWVYDGNGNTTRMPVVGGGYADLAYDVDNRLRTWTNAGNVEEYGYLADNKRVWKKAPAGAETYYLYGVGGQRLMTCSIVASPFSLICSMTHLCFGGKLIRADGDPVVHDRLGSVVARSTCDDCGNVVKLDYLPYGEEMGTATGGDVGKYGTNYRDGTTGLDYADQRYFLGVRAGRFLTSDPYEVSGGVAEPGSWNRYPYVGGDPVNFGDPRGLQAEKSDDALWRCMVSGLFDVDTEDRLRECLGKPSGGGSGGAGKNDGVKGVSKAKDAPSSEKCRKALGVDSPAAGAALVDSVEIQGGNLGPAVAIQTVGVEGMLQWELSYRVASTNFRIITLNSSVFDRPDALVGGSPLSVAWSVSQGLGLNSTISNEDFQALFLLHELAHIQNTIPSDAFVMANGEIGEDWAKSVANTRHIVDNCFKK